MTSWSERRPLPLALTMAAREAADAPFFQSVGEQARTFADIDRAAWDWAEVLHAVSVTAQDRVATLIPGSADAVAAWIGIGRLRAIEAPINLEYEGELLRAVIDYCRPSHLIVHRRLAETIAAIAADLVCAPVILVLEPGPQAVRERLSRLDGAALGEASAAPAPAHEDQSQLEDLCLILFTSGTTGLPKGVMITWAQIDAANHAEPPVKPNVIYAMTPMFHTSGRQGVSRAIIHRDHLVYRPRFSASHFWQDIADYGCTTAGLLANFMDYLATIGLPEGLESTPLKYIHTGRVPEAFLPIARKFGLQFATVFNMTEISPAIVSDGFRSEASASCGRMRPGYDCRIVDDLDCEVPVGEVGELVIRTDQPFALMQGYWDRPADTVAAWRNQWFHTGDLFRRDAEGNFYYLDRKQDRIRRRGENISGGLIENAALEHPDVKEAAAVGVNIGAWDDEIKLTVIPAEQAQIDPAALRRFMADALPDFMLPRYIDIAAELPKTATGKVQRTRLRAVGVGAETWDANT